MSIVLENITKRFANQWVVDDVSLEVADKELFVLLGSSGSGKSTILRMIAGLAQPTGGRILLHGRDVTDLTPQERGTGFVFQNYSIFRHMSVAQNIEFGLKIRKVSKQERKRRREQLLELVGLAGLGSRYAHQLSGGQQQRVALARALVYEPNVLLLDEPFGALDVKIRTQLRRSLKEIQQRLGVTTILVTHDQEEAFELADRIGVLERGRLLEVGPGESLYARPRSLFAATFLGAGTVLVGRAEQGQAKFGTLALPIPADVPHDEGAPVQLLFRPEQVALADDDFPAEMPVLGKGKTLEQSFSGALRRMRLTLPRPQGVRQIAPLVPFGEEGLLIDASVASESQLNGDELWIGLRAWTILKQPPPRLLVCDAGKGPTATLSIAKLLMERLPAAATILAVAENPEGAERLQASLKERQTAAGLEQAELHVRYGKPAEQIASEQASAMYEMLVMTTRPPSSVGWFRRKPKVSRLPARDSRARTRLLGETLVKLLEHADIPVLVAKGDRQALKRVLICTAAGEPGKSDVRVGGRLARLLGAEVTLLFVTRESEGPDSLTRSHLDRASATLRAQDVTSQVRVRFAETPLAGILEEAKDGDHDLIVIGSHGPRSRSLFALNDVTLQVLSTADRPVLVVPTNSM
ncbi:MAG TPA: ATP-binding cassette domain-containing protein [Blastocatellia bacterium]|nr:ATP-binding cassette domain-containing protein [Blastocatellia bacterium]